MNHQPLSDGCVEALREDLPTPADERRIFARLSAAGFGVSAALAPQTASAVLKAGVWSAVTTRFASLPLLTQMVLVAAGTTAVATPPVVLYHQHTRATELVTPSRILQSTAHAPLPISQNDVVPDGAEGPTAPEAAPALATKTNTGVLGGEPAVSPRKAAPESTLAEEARLLDAALAAIRGNTLDQAKQLIEQHASRYPNGRLVTERERARRKLLEAQAAITNDAR